MSNRVEPRSAIEALTASSNRQDALATLLVEQARQANPLLADLLCSAAVPRKFDASLLTMLTARRLGDEEFSVAFEALISMPFVVRSRDGRYRMHDEIRRALLTRFQDGDQNRELQALNERLADYYGAEHERARTVADQFDMVNVLLRRVSPDRVLAIRSAIEDQLVRPLLEAQYHRTVADPAGAGLAQFRRSFKLYEREGRVGVCRLLLRSWRDDIKRLAGEDAAALHDWGMYYRARLAVAEGDGERARVITEELQTQPRLDPTIRVRSQALVTDSLIAECRFVDALNETAAQIVLRGDKDPDPWSRSKVFRQQADIQGKLYDGDAQAASLGLALEAARSVGNHESEAEVLSELSTVLGKQGNVADAARHSIRALHIVRTFNFARNSQGAANAALECAAQLMRTFGACDPRLADLFRTEARHLTRGNDIRRTVELENSYVVTLIGTGQFERAHEVLDQLDERLSDQWPLERSGVLISRANVLDAEGRAREAVQRNRRAVEEVQRRRDNKFSLAAALTNVATTEMDIGELLDDACSSAKRARDLWLAMGHTRGVALTNVVEAEVSRRRADYTAAWSALGPQRPLRAFGLENFWYRVASHLAADLGWLDPAVDYAEFVVDNSISLGRLRDAAQAAAWLVEILMQARRVDDAVRASERLAAVMARLRELRQYRRTTASKQADEHNGWAVRQMSFVSESPLEAARNAVQHFEEALVSDPGPCWYSLNQAYALSRLGDRKSARESIDAAAAKAGGTAFEEPIGDLAAEFATFH
jgi:tetratricopeptide (TPR) repeat protein